MLLLLSLVVLADWTARVELAKAVNVALNDGARAVVQITVMDDSAAPMRTLPFVSPSLSPRRPLPWLRWPTRRR